MMDGLSREQVDRIGEALAAGRKVEAIRAYREATGKGLKEAKDDVDVLLSELHKNNPGRYPGARGCSSAALLFIALVVLFAWLL